MRYSVSMSFDTHLWARPLVELNLWCFSPCQQQGFIMRKIFWKELIFMFIIYKPCLLIRRGTVYPSRVVANTGKGNIHPYHDPDVLVKSPCRTSLANSNLYSWYFYIIYSWISRRGTGSHQNDDLSSHGETYFVQMTFPFHWMLNFLKTNIWGPSQ